MRKEREELGCADLPGDEAASEGPIAGGHPGSRQAAGQVPRSTPERRGRRQARQLTLAGTCPLSAPVNSGRPLAALFHLILKGMSDEAHFPAEQPGPRSGVTASVSACATVGGRKVLNARRARGRKKLSA